MLKRPSGATRTRASATLSTSLAAALLVQGLVQGAIGPLVRGGNEGQQDGDDQEEEDVQPVFNVDAQVAKRRDQEQDAGATFILRPAESARKGPPQAEAGGV